MNAAAAADVGAVVAPACPTTAAAWRVLDAALASANLDSGAAAGALVALGLGELAQEVLDRAGLGAPDPELTLMPARIEAGELCRNVRAALRTAGDRLQVPETDLDAWSRSLDDQRWYRTLDGNVVRVRAEGAGLTPARVIRLADDRSAAAAATLPPSGDTHRPPPPICLEGVSPPWLLVRLRTEWARMSIYGACGRLWVMQREARELLDGLAHADLSGVLATDHVVWLVGDDAPARFEAALREHDAFIPVAMSIVLPTVATRSVPPPGEIIARVTAGSERRAERLAPAIAVRGATRDVAWWSARYEHALRGEAPPLRILATTCRFSAYVGAAAAEIALAFEAIGCEARVLVEPADWLGMTRLAMMDAIDGFDPDLVLTINSTRERMGSAVPSSVPVVCWMQDAMPHLFGEWAKRLGPLDFLVGHRFAEHKGIAGLRDRLLVSTVPACGRTFDREPSDTFDCEIGVFMNHGEPADRMLARVMMETNVDRAVAPALTKALAELRQLVTSPIGHDLRAAVTRLASDVAPGRDPEMAAMIERHLLMPVADRLLRHTVVDWAARVCARRGWRLRLHGRGWASHPRLASLAHEPIEHGPALRDAYRGAAVTLHASASWITHQRVIECALSGGFPSVLVKRTDVHDLYTLGCETASLRVRPFVSDVALRTTFARACDDPATTALWAHLQRIGAWVGEASVDEASVGQAGVSAHDLGGAFDGTFVWYPHLAGEPVRISEAAEEIRLHADLPETGFFDEASLEALVERAVTRPAWRRDHVRRMARCARESFTYERATSKIMSFVRRGLARAAGSSPAS